MKLSKAFDTFIEYEVNGMGKAKNTARSYENARVAFIKYYGDREIRRITLDDIHNFYLDVIQKSSINTGRTYIARVRVVLGYFYQKGMARVNPNDIKTPREEKRATRFLSEYEVQKFVEHVGEYRQKLHSYSQQRDTLIVKTLFATGLRIGELCALNRDSIQDRQFVVVGKSKQPRPCFITTEIETLIKEYLKTRTDDCEALFVNDWGNRISPDNVRRMFKKVLHSCGMNDITPHTLRHSFATKLIDEGVDIRFVAAFLGHQNLQTTQRYTHVRNCKLYEIYQQKIENHSCVGSCGSV